MSSNPPSNKPDQNNQISNFNRYHNRSNNTNNNTNNRNNHQTTAYGDHNHRDRDRNYNNNNANGRAKENGKDNEMNGPRGSHVDSKNNNKHSQHNHNNNNHYNKDNKNQNQSTRQNQNNNTNNNSNHENDTHHNNPFSSLLPPALDPNTFIIAPIMGNNNEREVKVWIANYKRKIKIQKDKDVRDGGGTHDNRVHASGVQHKRLFKHHNDEDEDESCRDGRSGDNGGGNGSSGGNINRNQSTNNARNEQQQSQRHRDPINAYLQHLYTTIKITNGLCNQYKTKSEETHPLSSFSSPSSGMNDDNNNKNNHQSTTTRLRNTGLAHYQLLRRIVLKASMKLAPETRREFCRRCNNHLAGVQNGQRFHLVQLLQRLLMMAQNRTTDQPLASSSTPTTPTTQSITIQKLITLFPPEWQHPLIDATSSLQQAQTSSNSSVDNHKNLNNLLESTAIIVTHYNTTDNNNNNTNPTATTIVATTYASNRALKLQKHMQRYGDAFRRRTPNPNRNQKGQKDQQPSQDYFSLTLAQRAVFERNAKKRADATAIANRRKQAKLTRLSSTTITISPTPLFQRILSLATTTTNNPVPPLASLGSAMIISSSTMPAHTTTATTTTTTHPPTHIYTQLLTLSLALKKPLLLHSIEAASLSSTAALSSSSHPTPTTETPTTKAPPTETPTTETPTTEATTTETTTDTTATATSSHAHARPCSFAVVDLPLFVTCDCCGYSKEIWTKDAILQTHTVGR